VVLAHALTKAAHAVVATTLAVAVVFLGLGLFSGGSRSLVNLTSSNGSLSGGSRCGSSLCWGSSSGIDRGASSVVVVLAHAVTMVGTAVLVTAAVAVAVVFLGLGLFRGGSRSLVDLTGSNGSLSGSSRCGSSLRWGSSSGIDRGASSVVVVLVHAVTMVGTTVLVTTAVAVAVVFLGLGLFRGGSGSLVDLASSNGSLSGSSRCRCSLGRRSSRGIGRGASGSSVVVVVMVLAHALTPAATMGTATAAAAAVVFLGLGLLRGGDGAGTLLACSDHISELARNLFKGLRVLEFTDIVLDGLLTSLEFHIGIAGEERVGLFEVVSKNTGRSNDNSGEERDGCRETHSDSV